MELAQRALGRIPKETRQIRTLTVGMDEERWKELQTLIQDFQQDGGHRHGSSRGGQGLPDQSPGIPVDQTFLIATLVIALNGYR
jgi:hypothetical protein